MSNDKRKWSNVLLSAVKKVAQSQKLFTTDDVWKHVPNLSHRPEPRALGTVLTEMRKSGLIKATKDYQTSTRRECHGRPIKVWESLIAKETSHGS